MRYFILMLFVANILFVSGCTKPSPEDKSTKKVQMRHSAYLGKSITLFILDNGTPYANRKLKDGRVVYAWNSGRVGAAIYPYKYGTFWEDDFMKDECEIRLIVSADKKIQQIYALDNFYKNWDPSDCSDFLK